MAEPFRLNRRSFNVAWASALLGGAAITITGCGGGSDSPTSPSSPAGSGSSGGTGGKSADIAENHGHTGNISAAQLSAGGQLTLSIRGSATHDHTVVLSASEVTSIAGGTRVAKTSSSEQAHTHTVTFN